MNALEFVESVWQEQGEGFAFLSLRTGPRRWRDFCFKYPQDEMVLPDDSIGDVYFCPNLFKRPRRRKGMMLPSCWLYADLDTVDPRGIELPVFEKPAAAWETSPGRYQAIWLVEKGLEEEQHSYFNQRLTYKLDADKGGWDVTQVLRVPGTVNHKYKDKPEVKLLWTEYQSLG